MSTPFLYTLIIVLLFTLEGILQPAYAYIGAGLSVGSFIVVLALILSVVLAIVSLFWYPIKRALFGQKEESTDEEDLDEEDE